ncbi:MAG: hypothetical protein HOP17_01320 [Acidobacteria bacterium]|nr:hypothetical protein [Acidobacteriota bacterium]
MNETGSKTFLWYRVYCAFMVFLYLAVAAFGVALLVSPFETSQADAGQIRIIGTINAALGLSFFFLFAVALFLPAKPYNWIIGFVSIAIGMTSCCTWPATIPLLIYWVKPETKTFFGRK